MKNLKRFLFLSVIIINGLSIASCKSKDKNNDNNVTTQPVDTAAPVMQAAPVVISADDSLTTMAKDAVKDFPGVTASVMNGEVTLAGTIKRDKLKPLMSAISAMHPKKINNNLTINP